MKAVFANTAIMTFAAATVFTCGPVSAFAITSSTTTGSAVPLRAEIAAEYNQAHGLVTAAADGGVEVCVTSTSFESEPTGNAADGAEHCHTLLTRPARLGVQLNSGKVDLPVTSVGNKALKLSGIVDTGSGGVTLNAFQIFPSSMVTSSGFNFDGKDQLVYKGITVTRLVATRNYGSQGLDPTSRTGNLGFAHLSFGENGKIRTALIPILFIYTSTVQPSETTGDLDNTIGINDEMAAVGDPVSYDGQATTTSAATSATISPECTLKSMSTCSLVSPFRALSYGQDLQAGFILHDFPLVDGQKGKYLTVGLDQSNSKSFATTQLQCATSALKIESCNQEVRNAQIMTSAGLSFTWNVIFDSGRPNVNLSDPVNNANPPARTLLPAGETVTVTPPNQTGYTYSFTTGTQFAATTLTYIDSNATDASGTYSNMGLEFFATNSLLLDYDKGIEGWKTADTTQ